MRQRIREACLRRL